jgi:hypothetical protein
LFEKVETHDILLAFIVYYGLLYDGGIEFDIVNLHVLELSGKAVKQNTRYET